MVGTVSIKTELSIYQIGITNKLFLIEKRSNACGFLNSHALSSSFEKII